MTDYSLQLLKGQFPNIDFECIYLDLNKINEVFVYVAGNGHLEVCKWLMQFNPDVHVYSDAAFRYAAKNGHLEVCKWLMQFNPNVHVYNDQSFRCAFDNNHLELCKWLINLNPIYYRNFINKRNDLEMKELLKYIQEPEKPKDSLIEKILRLDNEEERLFYYKHLIKNRDVKKFFSRFVDSEIVQELID